MLLNVRKLNVMLLGDEPAQHLGVDVERLKQVLLGAATLTAAAAVAVSGVIGFVGLIIPHAVRLVVGPDHRVLLPAATLAGAIFLTAADTLARVAAAPGEIPVGVITALCGGPFFIYLLRKKKEPGFKQGVRGAVFSNTGITGVVIDGYGEQVLLNFGEGILRAGEGLLCRFI